MILIGEYESISSKNRKQVESYYTTENLNDKKLTLPINTVIQKVFYNGNTLTGDTDYTFKSDTGAFELLTFANAGGILAIKYETDFSTDFSQYQELKNYCLRRLGAPTLKVNVTDAQLNDCLIDGIQKYIQWHYDGSELVYLAIPIDDEARKNGYVTLPRDIIGIRRCIRTGSDIVAPLLSAQYMFVSDLIWSMTGSNISSYGFSGLQYYYITRDYLNLFQNIVYPEQAFQFNEHTHKIHIVENSQTPSGNYFVVAECYQALNFAEYPDAYNDVWLKKYCVQLVKRQWGVNLMKYSGIELAGGITIDGKGMFEEANAEIDKLDEELYNRYKLPPLIEIA